MCLIPCHDIRFHKLTGAIKGVVHICCGWWNCKPSPFNNNLSYSIHSWTWFCWNQRDLIILLQISQVFELTGQIIMKRPYFYKKLFKKMIDSCSRINCSYDTNNSFWLPLYDEKNNTNAICHTSVPILFHIFCSINMKTIIKKTFLSMLEILDIFSYKQLRCLFRHMTFIPLKSMACLELINNNYIASNKVYTDIWLSPVFKNIYTGLTKTEFN